MSFLGSMASKVGKSALGAFFLLMSVGIADAQTAPYLLPYTITTIAGGGTAPSSVGVPCPSGVAGQTVGNIIDTSGNGCLATSPSVVTSSDTHDVGVDSVGNVYFIDNGSPLMIRRIDGRSGIVTLFVGSTSSKVCAAAVDKWGDNCSANDGAGNVAGGFTVLTTTRGLNVAKNGDVYIADYSGRLIHRISAATGIMSIIAGALTGTAGSKNSATGGYTGDGGPGNNAEVNSPRGVTADAAGNVYIADTTNNVIRMVNYATGVISTIVGKYPGSNTSAPAGAGGDGGPATAAQLSGPEDVEIDANGNLFIADFGNNRIRVVYAGGAQVAALIAATNGNAVAVAGNIYTIMGGGTGTYAAGSVVLATSVPVSNVRKIALDARGNVYLADNGNDVIWFEDATTGYMRVIAGTPTKTSGGAGCGLASPIGDGCQGTLATLNPNSAMGVSVDSTGNIYISDSGDQRIRKVSLNQSFPTVTAGGSATQTIMVHFAIGDTPAATSPFVVAGSADFVVTPGNCALNSDNTTDCTLTVTFSPTRPGIDTAMLTVKSSAGSTSQFALNGTGAAAAVALDPGTAAGFGAGFNSPAGISLDSAGNSYVADTGNNVVVRYDSAGNKTVIAGTGTAGNSGNGGPATAAALSAPSAVTVTPNGAIYIADKGNNVVRRIDPLTGVINVVAGGSTTTCTLALNAFGDGCPGTQANLSGPAGLASDSRGNVFISDTGNNTVRELTSSGYIFNVGGAVFSSPTGLQVDGGTNIFVADTGHSTIRKIVAVGGAVVTVAGNGQNGSAGNGGAATDAELSNPTGIALDAAGNLYIADTGNQVIRSVNGTGTINTVAGTLGQSGSGALPGPVNGLLLNLPGGIGANTAGKLYVLDSGNNRAYTIDRTSVVENLGTVSPNNSSPVQTIQETNTGSLPVLLSQSSSQSVFTTTGDGSVFAVTGQGSSGCSANLNLTSGATCFWGAQFNPVAVTSSSATFTETNTSPVLPVAPSITLSGLGANLVATTSATVLTSPASGNPQFGVPFVVATTVTPASCNPSAPSCVPTGTVQFFVGTAPVGVPVALNGSGVASTSISGQNVGTHSVTAVYNGDSFYGSSTAPAFNVTVTTGAANVVVTFSAASVPQFQPLTIIAKASSATGGIPTGSVAFFADGKSIGAAQLDATGTASIVDPLPGTDPSTNQPYIPNSFGLFAGAHAVTAVYAGDANYSKSTSPAATLTIQPDAPGFQAFFISPTTLGQVTSLSAGTAQGSTALATVVVVPSNTLNGTVTFACSGLPANSVCTVTPTNLVFAPVAGSPASQSVGVTLWTDVSPGVVPTATSHTVRPSFGTSRSGTALASMLGWPVLLISFAGVFGFRKRLRTMGLLTVLVLAGLLGGSSMILSGCSTGAAAKPSLTPVGAYKVNLTVSGPNSTSVTMPIQFTVAAGVAGQE